MEWYWQSKPDALGDKPVLVPLCPCGVVMECSITEQLTSTLTIIMNWNYNYSPLISVTLFYGQICKTRERFWTVSLKLSRKITAIYLSTAMFNSIHSLLHLTLKQGLKKAKLGRDLQARALSFQIRQSSKLSTNCESLFRSPRVRRHGFYLHEPVSWLWKGRGGVGGYIGENSQCPTFNREIKINEWLNTLSQTSGQKPSNQPPEFRSQRVHTKAKLWAGGGGWGRFSFIATQKQRR